MFSIHIIEINNQMFNWTLFIVPFKRLLLLELFNNSYFLKKFFSFDLSFTIIYAVFLVFILYRWFFMNWLLYRVLFQEFTQKDITPVQINQTFIILVECFHKNLWIRRRLGLLLLFWIWLRVDFINLPMPFLKHGLEVIDSHHGVLPLK